MHLHVLGICGTFMGGLAAIAQAVEAALAKRAIDRDLELAHKVQQGILPGAPPNVPGYSFFDYYEPARQVGGDYFDYVTLDDGERPLLALIEHLRGARPEATGWYRGPVLEIVTVCAAVTCRLACRSRRIAMAARWRIRSRTLCRIPTI